VTTRFTYNENQGDEVGGVAIDSRDRVVAAGQAGGNFKLARYIGYP
jgi:hypothetical protein